MQEVFKGIYISEKDARFREQQLKQYGLAKGHLKNRIKNSLRKGGQMDEYTIHKRARRGIIPSSKSLFSCGLKRTEIVFPANHYLPRIKHAGLYILLLKVERSYLLLTSRMEFLKQ